jgi:hypothetical protein
MNSYQPVKVRNFIWCKNFQKHFLFSPMKVKIFGFPEYLKQIVLGVSCSVPLKHQLWLLKILDCDFSKPNPTDQMFSVEILK